jgi:hypothetical protein
MDLYFTFLRFKLRSSSKVLQDLFLYIGTVDVIAILMPWGRRLAVLGVILSFPQFLTQIKAHSSQGFLQNVRAD